MHQNDSLFHELDDRLSVIKRWAIVRTVATQSVAVHCFNVQRICIKLAPHFGITEFEDLFELSQAALHHDDDEAVTGDTPGPAKKYIHVEKGIDVGATAWYDDASDEIKAIVKLADMLEAYHFLTMEAKLGNSYIRNHRARVREMIHNFIRNHHDWPTNIMYICNEWMSAVYNEVSEVHPNGTSRGPKEGTTIQPG